ncbi:MAG TPA: ATP synthase F1 subunit gamma [Gemmatimonadales bacterium]|nr:ATP synthase F1 subunit gamma [Gemmatimonadales bacterium]
MAKTRVLRRRIRSIESTRKITRTMEMVATSKLKRAQDRVVAARPYAQALAAAIADLLTPELAERYALLRPPAPPSRGGPRRAAVLLLTSNRGLAGAFNANLIKTARARIEELEAKGYEVELHAVGKKGIRAFQFARRALATSRTDIGDVPSAAHAIELVEPLMRGYEAGRLASVDVVYANFKSALSTPPAVMRVLPVEAGKRDGAKAVTETERGAAGHTALPPHRLTAHYILKPSADEILTSLLPLYVRNQVYRALVETAASEQGARRTAMKNATDNAGELLEILRRTYNRARQAQITQELAEIVGGAEALKG